MNKTKVTKKAQFLAIAAILAKAEEAGFVLNGDDITFAGLNEFINHEISLIENKAVAAAKRAKDKKAAGDELRERIFAVLNDECYMTITEIVAELNEPDVSPQMVTSRLSQLVDLNRAIKDSITVPASSEGGRSRKVSAYKRAN